MKKLNLIYLCIVFVIFIFVNCSNQKEEDKTTERRGESFLNCYLVQKNNAPEKSDEIVFQECIPCYAQICNFPHLL